MAMEPKDPASQRPRPSQTPPFTPSPGPRPQTRELLPPERRRIPPQETLAAPQTSSPRSRQGSDAEGRGGISTESQRPSQRFSFRAPQESFTASDFSYGRLLGLGSYSKVVKATKKDTGVTCALKIMDKMHIVKENKTAYVKMERIILDQLDHPGIIRLQFTFQDKHYLYMGLECCEGGELFDQIRRKVRLSFEEARFYAAELADVMEYIHGQGLIHRDLKPENILLTSDGHLKVCDFGSAKMLRPFSNGLIQNLPDDKSCTFVGTAEYVSPEVLNSYPVTIGVDLWALGCILYQLLVGRPPFKCASEYLTFQKVMARDFQLPDFLASEAKDLINRLLDLDPKKRPGAGPEGYTALRNHPFFHGIEWAHLRELPTPPLALPQGNFEDGTVIYDDALDPDWELAHMGGGVAYKDVNANARGNKIVPAQMGGNVSQKSMDYKLKESFAHLQGTTHDEPSAHLESSTLDKLANLALNETRLSSTQTGEHTVCNQANFYGKEIEASTAVVPEVMSSRDMSLQTNRGISNDSSSENILYSSNEVNSLRSTSIPRISNSPRGSVNLKDGDILDDNSPEWLKFLFPDEKIKLMSLVKKLRKLSVKRRMLILTDRPRLIYIDPQKMTQKGEIQWSWNASELFVRPENESNFIIWTPKHTYTFEDTRNLAWQWKDAIETVQTRV